MHLHALNNNGKIIPVQKASKQQNYFCLECKGLVRRRSGSRRTPHFFHLKPSVNCRQYAKSMAHLQTQNYLYSILPVEDCQLEYPFPAIKRIADVVWFSRKIVFEIQCSPISSDEVQSRNKDYSSQGYQVIWVLHDQRFNQWKLSAAENYLLLSPHYYTNIDAEGNGVIYDQGYLIKNGVRKERMPIMPIDPNHPFLMTAPAETLPSLLEIRVKHWPIYFSGDLLSEKINHPEMYILDEKKIKHRGVFRQRAKGVLHAILDLYDLVFRMLLEKVCR